MSEPLLNILRKHGAPPRYLAHIERNFPTMTFEEYFNAEAHIRWAVAGKGFQGYKALARAEAMERPKSSLMRILVEAGVSIRLQGCIKAHCPTMTVEEARQRSDKVDVNT